MVVRNMLRMLRNKKGSIAWEYIVGLIIAIVLIVLFALLSNEVKGAVMKYVKEIFKGTFWS